MNSLGILYGRRIRGARADNLERAIALYRETLEVYTPERYPRDRAGTLNNLATALRARHLGDRRANEEETIAALQEAVGVFTRVADPHNWAGTMSNLGTALFERRTGDLATHIDGAIAAYEAALGVRTEADHPWDWAATRFNLGQALWRRYHGDRDADLRAAAEALEDSLRVRTRERAPDEWAGTQSMRAVVFDELAERGDPHALSAAETAYRRALEIYTPDRFPFEARANANNFAGMLLREGRSAEALAVARDGLRAAEVLYLAAPTEEGREVELEDNARLYRIGAEAALESGCPAAEVFAFTEAGRARLLSDWLAVGDLPTPAGLEGADAERNLIGELRETLRSARELGAGSARQGAVDTAARVRKELEAVWRGLELQPGGAAFVARRRGEPVNADRLQEWLNAQPGRAGMVVLAPLRERPIGFVAFQGGGELRLVRTEITHNEIGALIDRLEREVVDVRGPLPNHETWTAIGEAVLGPALEQLPDDLDLLYIVPFGLLHSVPWHAGIVDGSPLAERMPVVSLPGAGAGLHLPCEPAPLPGPDTLVVGDPLGDLTHARAEAEAVAAEVGAAELIGDRADRRTVSARLASATWAHFAAHGVYEPDDPMASGIELADGRLTARELMRLGGVRRVVVSTCESGRQQVAGGDELWGLARALLYTGTNTALLTLWPIDDRVTREIMRRFYAELAEPVEPGRPRVAEALRQAMLAVRERHPQTYLWAPFTVLGSPW